MLNDIILVRLIYSYFYIVVLQEERTNWLNLSCLKAKTVKDHVTVDISLVSLTHFCYMIIDDYFI